MAAMNFSRAGKDGAPDGVAVVAAYGDGGFRVGGNRVEGSVMIVNNQVHSWSVQHHGDLTLESMASLDAADPAVEILLIGTGAALAQIPGDVRAALAARGVNVDVMDTGAAARTYNVLTLENRRVAAALIAVE